MQKNLIEMRTQQIDQNYTYLVEIRKYNLLNKRLFTTISFN